MPVCKCGAEILMDQMRCTSCGKRLSLDPLVTNQFPKEPPVNTWKKELENKNRSFSEESMREVRAEAKKREKSKSKKAKTRNAGSSKSSSTATDSLYGIALFNRLGLAIAIFSGIGSYSTYSNNPNSAQSQNVALFLAAIPAIYLLWLAIYFSNTVRCEYCKSLFKQGFKSRNPRKRKKKALVAVHHRGQQNGWRTVTERNQMRTDYYSDNSGHVGYGISNSSSKRVVPTQTNYYTDEFLCPDCGYNWTSDYSKSFDL